MTRTIDPRRPVASWAAGSLRSRLAAISVILVVGLVVASVVATTAVAAANNQWGVDLGIMRALGHRWMVTGSMYAPYQLAGPYSLGEALWLSETPGVYPPAVAPLYAGLSLVPVAFLFLWWIVPIAIVARWVVRCRPVLWAWVMIAACFVWPLTSWQFFVGGTAMWTTAFVAAGLRWPGAAALVLLKPTLWPFALIGFRHRSWWLVVMVIAVLTMLGPWRDYLTVISYTEATGGLLYSLGNVPMMAIPVIAQLGRGDRSHGGNDSTIDSGV